MTLQVRIGQYSTAGCKSDNQDCLGAMVPKGAELQQKGVVLAIADGISSSSVSQIASETAVKSFLADYYCTHDAWSVPHAALQVLKACHHWLCAQNRHSAFGVDPDKGYVCTFSALILKQQTAYLVHVGDSRIYLLRNAELEQLTRDHRLWRGGTSYLSQALGIAGILEPEQSSLPLLAGDLFLLATDGLFESLSQSQLLQLLTTNNPDLEQLAAQLAEAALAAGSQDNISLQLIRVEALPQLPQAALFTGQQHQQLPLPAILKAGDVLDGYQVQKVLQHSSRSHLYLMQDLSSKALLVLKAPSLEGAEQPEYLEKLLTEEWIAKRVQSPFVLKAHPALAGNYRSALYSLFEYVQGQTLRQWQQANPAPAFSEVLGLIQQIGKGLQAMHRAEILHQDLRPENLLLDTTGCIKIIDFGAARLSGLQNDAQAAGDIPGTALYTAPEYFLGAAGSELSDLYSLAVLTYHLLSGRFPYGADVGRAKSKAAQKKLQYQSVINPNAELPLWLDTTLKKALQPEPALRYQALSEFLYDLQHARPHQQPDDTDILKPAVQPVWLWQCLCVGQTLVILYLLLLP